jgi:hypothetical protein
MCFYEQLPNQYLGLIETGSWRLLLVSTHTVAVIRLHRLRNICTILGVKLQLLTSCPAD